MSVKSKIVTIVISTVLFMVAVGFISGYIFLNSVNDSGDSVTAFME